MRTDEVSDLIRDVSDRLIVPRFRTLCPNEIEQKLPGDLVTIADREAEVALTQALETAMAGVLVVGEEASFGHPELVSALPGAELAFVVDPVDGTRNFASGSPDFGVMVAEVRFGVPVRSWIWQPMHGHLFVAERGCGVLRDGEPLAPMAIRERPYRVEVYGDLRRDPAPGLVLGPTQGACAVDYPRLLAGSVDALGYRVINAWDHLPGMLMTTELGGFVGLDGVSYRPGVPGRLVFAGASPGVHDAVVTALSDRASVRIGRGSP